MNFLCWLLSPLSDVALVCFALFIELVLVALFMLAAAVIVLIAFEFWMWLIGPDCSHGLLPAGCAFPVPGGYMGPPR